MLVHEVSRFIVVPARDARGSKSAPLRSFVGETLALLARHPLITYPMSPAPRLRADTGRRGRYPPRLSRDDVLREPASRPSRRDDLLARISRASGLVPRPARPGSPRRDPHRRRAIVPPRSSRSDVVVRNPSRGRDALSSPPASERPSPDPPGPLDHARHRDAVLSQLPPGKLVYVPAGKAQTRNGVEGNARFRQEPDFLYLTGVEEPGYHALFGTGADAPFVLIAPRQDPEMDVWCGKQASRDELRAVTGADIVYYDDEFHKALGAVEAQEGQTVFVPSHDAAGLPNDPDGLFLGLRPETTALGKVMAKARSLKTSEEIVPRVREQSLRRRARRDVATRGAGV